MNNKNRTFLLNLTNTFIFPADFVGEKLLAEYGAIFVARGDALSPDIVVFQNEKEVAEWQNRVPQLTENIGGIEITLQTPAMKAVKNAVAEAEQNNLTITPRGVDAAKRNYSGTVELWASRVNPGLIHWVEQGKLAETEASKIRALSPFEQVTEIFKLEEQSIFFAKDLSKSIIYSVAPPGTSQHISMLALDICEFNDLRVRGILANHGWFQTVISDLPHFTFLGVSQNQLADLGLKRITDGERDFWIPNI